MIFRLKNYRFLGVAVIAVAYFLESKINLSFETLMAFRLSEQNVLKYLMAQQVFDSNNQLWRYSTETRKKFQPAHLFPPRVKFW
jgi:hypothetical protein